MELKKTPSPPERFLRGKRQRGRPGRRIGSLVLRWFGMLAAFAGLAAAFFWTVTTAGHAPELTVARVLVEGNERLSDGEILELLELSEGANILTLDLEDVRERLLRSAWVREVEIQRVLPRTLTLRIAERSPVAIAVLGELYLLAADGTMLDELAPHYDIEKLVLIRGLRNADGVVPARAALAGRTAAALMERESLAALVSELDVSEGDGSVTVRLREPAVTFLVHSATMVARLERLVPLLGGLQKRYQALVVVDLRFDGRIYLRLRDVVAAKEFKGREIYTAAAFVPGGASF